MPSAAVVKSIFVRPTSFAESQTQNRGIDAIHPQWPRERKGIERGMGTRMEAGIWVNILRKNFSRCGKQNFEKKEVKKCGCFT